RPCDRRCDTARDALACGREEGSVDRQEAERALEIIRRVVENTRDDLVARNWGLVWIVHAFTNAAAFAAVGLLVESRGMTVLWYLVPLAAVAAVDLVIMLLLTERDRGVKSFVELQLHGIWVTFIVFSAGAAVVLQLAGPPTAARPRARAHQRYRLRDDGGRLLAPLPARGRAVLP